MLYSQQRSLDDGVLIYRTPAGKEAVFVGY
jgi:hypothetical protein